MGIALTLSEVLLGATASPDHRVDNLLLLRKLEEMEAAIYAAGASIYYEDSLSDLNAVASPPQGSIGFVIADVTVGNRGVYRRGVSSWSKTANLPGAFSDSLGALSAVDALEGVVDALAASLGDLDAALATNRADSDTADAAQVAALVAEAAARASGDVALAASVSAETAARIAEANQVAARMAEVAAHWRDPRPGLEPADFRKGLAQNAPRYSVADTIQTSEGPGLLVTGAAYVVTGAIVPIGALQLDAINFCVMRTANVADPAGDGIRFGVVCYGADGQVLAGADGFVTLGEVLTDLNLSGQMHAVSGLVSRGIPADIILPPAARAYAPAIRTYGENAGLAVLYLERQRRSNSDPSQSVTADAVGDLADRSDHDAAPEGFVYLAADQAPWEYYVRVGAAGNWAGPNTFAGPTGAAGISVGASFPTHAAASAWLTANVPPDGVEFMVGRARWITASADTSVATLHGARPSGSVTPQHFEGTDWTAIDAMMTWWTGQYGTATSASQPVAGALPVVFPAGQTYTATAFEALVSGGAGQRIVFEPGARLQNIGIQVIHAFVEVIDPDIVGTVDMDFGIEVKGTASSIRGVTIHDPVIRNVQKSDYEAAGIRTTDDTPQLAIIRPYVEACDIAFDVPRSRGMMVTSANFMLSRRNNIRVTRGGEIKMNGAIQRGSAREGIKIVGDDTFRAVEHYWTDVTSTGNHTEVASRWNWPILSVSNDGGDAMFTVASHKVYSGQRNIVIGGTGLYDGTYDIVSVTDTTFKLKPFGAGEANVAYAGNATGTLYHPGFDVWAEGQSDLLARVNDQFFIGGNINSTGLKNVYNVMFLGTRLKDSIWLDGNCNQIYRHTVSRGRNDDSWADVPIAGQASGFTEVMPIAPGATGPGSASGYITRTPLTAAGLVANLPAKYVSQYLDGTGHYFTGPVSMADGMVVGGAAEGGWQITIADDAVGTITPPRQGGYCLVTCAGNNASPLWAQSGQFWVDTGSSLQIEKIAGGANCVGVITNVTGTTGTDGNTTVAAQAGALKIENRSGGSRTYQVRWL